MNEVLARLISLRDQLVIGCTIQVQDLNGVIRLAQASLGVPGPSAGTYRPPADPAPAADPAPDAPADVLH